MSRTRKGTVQWVPATTKRAGHYKARITAPNGTRPWIDLDPSPRSPQAEERAREKAAHWTERAKKKNIGAPPAQTVSEPSVTSNDKTVRGYAARWLADRERRGLSSVATDRGRLKNHVLPIIGDRPIAEVTRDELRAVVESLDKKTLAGTFSWKTAGRCWGLVTKMFADAVDSKTAALRVRSDNPCLGLPGPDRGARKSKQWLYPSEVSALLACARVPLRWRRLYALAIYLYPRPGELAALDWSAVHLEQRYAHIHRAIDQRTGTIKPTKTNTTRKIPVRPELLPLLEALHAENGSGLVVRNEHPNRDAHQHGMPPLEDLAATLRDHLLRAGVDRAELFNDTPTTRRVTFYDLRATGITWEALAGTEHLRIMQRAGHANFSTTLGYIREAEAVGMHVGEPFPELPEALITGRATPRIVPPNRPETIRRDRSSRKRSRKQASPTGFEPVLQP